MEKEKLYIGKRFGVLVGVWTSPPAMFGVLPQHRTQDEDVDFTEVDADDPEVVEHRRPKTRPVEAAEQKLARIGLTKTELADLLKDV